MAIKTITLKNNEKVVKKSLALNEGTLTKWNEFITKTGSDKSLLLTAALEHFMNEYEGNNVEVMIKL